MPCYRVRFLDHANRVFGTDEMECASDEDAVTRARQIHRHGIGKGYEIWEDERCVHIEPRR